LLPTGAGGPKRYQPIKGDIFSPKFLGNGKQIIFVVRAGASERMYLMTLDTGEVKPALPEGVMGFGISPDGKYVAASTVSDPRDKIYDLSGGPRALLQG